MSIAITTALDILIAAPPETDDLRAGFMGKYSPECLGGVWSPVLMVEPARHDPARGWFGSDIPIYTLE